MKKCDEPLEEIWEIRHMLSKTSDYDPKKAAAYYRDKQRKAGAKLYRRVQHLAGTQ